MVGLGEPEATNELAGCELGQVFAALLFRSIGINGVHDERRLHAHGRSITGVDALDLPRDQPVCNMTQLAAAIAFRHRGTQKSHDHNQASSPCPSMLRAILSNAS